MQEEKRWILLDRKEMHPRFWLRTETENLLLSWAVISQIRASEDFLSISFLCEYGLIQLSSAESMLELFKGLLSEKVWRIEGALLGCKIMPLE